MPNWRVNAAYAPTITAGTKCRLRARYTDSSVKNTSALSEWVAENTHAAIEKKKKKQHLRAAGSEYMSETIA